MDIETMLSEISTYDLEQELNVRYKGRRMLIAIKQFERATGENIQQATQTEHNGVTRIELELK